jgi:hypothetical protein
MNKSKIGPEPIADSSAEEVPIVAAVITKIKRTPIVKKASSTKPTKKSPTKKTISRKPANPATSLAKGKRNFPQHSIESSKKIAEALKQFNMGNPWRPRDLAEALAMGFSGGFFYLTQSARDYGLTIGTKESTKIELTDLGRSLVYPKSPEESRQAVLNAFLNVELFKKVYEYYQGANLPEIQYLKNTLKIEFGLSEEFQDEFYSLYQANLAYLKSEGAVTTSVQANRETQPVSSGNSSIIVGESNNAGTLVAFVAMPFSEKTAQHAPGYFDEVLKHLITPAAVKANFNARTAKKSGSEVIQSTIVNDLDNADLVIVDLTEHNPNVLFELGMRIAFNKPVCLIRAKGTAPIFDIDHMLRVFDYNPSLWASTLATDVPSLSEFISETWKNRESERSYLNILRETK